MPLSTIVVHTSTSNSRSQKSCTTRSSRALVHLPVRDGDPRLGHQRAHVLGDELDVAHAVVHVEHLALAQQLAPDRLGDGTVVVLADVREDRLAVLGRRVHERQVADAGERQLERARDRRGGEREHVDVRAQLLDALLVLHAEALLLVDDEQPELGHAYVVGQQAVRADQDVDRARLEIADAPPAAPCVDRNRDSTSTRTG